MELTVLVVDDETFVRETIALVLEESGVTVHQAVDGVDAIRSFQQHTYDFAFIDLIMPNREGLDTIMEVRRQWPETNVIAMSGGGRMGAVDLLDLAQSLGAHQTLMKPFRPAQLLSLIGSKIAPQLGE